MTSRRMRGPSWSIVCWTCRNTAKDGDDIGWTWLALQNTSGYERDQEKPFAWKYRDWVVAAFNSDMPLDQFIVEPIGWR